MSLCESGRSRDAQGDNRDQLMDTNTGRWRGKERGRKERADEREDQAALPQALTHMASPQKAEYAAHIQTLIGLPKCSAMAHGFT